MNAATTGTMAWVGGGRDGSRHLGPAKNPKTERARLAAIAVNRRITDARASLSHLPSLWLLHRKLAADSAAL